MSVSMHYWESDQKWHLDPEPITQERVIKILEEYAQWVDGKNALDLLNIIANPNEKLFEAIKDRIVYLMDKNDVDDPADEKLVMLPLITWLDGFGVGYNVSVELG